MGRILKKNGKGKSIQSLTNWINLFHVTSLTSTMIIRNRCTTTAWWRPLGGLCTIPPSLTPSPSTQPPVPGCLSSIKVRMLKWRIKALQRGSSPSVWTMTGGQTTATDKQIDLTLHHLLRKVCNISKTWNHRPINLWPALLEMKILLPDGRKLRPQITTSTSKMFPTIPDLRKPQQHAMVKNCFHLMHGQEAKFGSLAASRKVITEI